MRLASTIGVAINEKAECIMRPAIRLFLISYSSLTNSSLPTPQIGQTQSSGKSSKAVPGAIPLSGSPTSGS